MNTMNKIKTSFLLLILGVLMFSGFFVHVEAQTDTIQVPDETQIQDFPGQVVDLFYLLPTLVLGLMVVMIIIASVVILIKTLNPMSGESEENFSKGKKWFQGTGVLLVAPLIMLIIIAFVWITLGFGNPLTYLSTDPGQIESEGGLNNLQPWCVSGTGECE